MYRLNLLNCVRILLWIIIPVICSDTFLYAQQGPTTNPDTYTMDWDTALTVPAPGVLGNDHDPDGDALEAHLRQPPDRGTLSLFRDGGFTYTPVAGESYITTFVYKAWDGHFPVEETVTLEVVAGNAFPIALEDHFTAPYGTRFTLAPPGVLANDHDPEAGPLTAYLTTPPERGTLGFHADGSLWFENDGTLAPCDTVSFTYKVVDDHGHKAYAQVTITLEPTDTPQLVGTPPESLPLYAPLVYHPVWTGAVSEGVVFSLDEGPEGMALTIDGRLSWVPDNGQAGTHPVRLHAVDGCGRFAEQAFNVHVDDAAVNRPPRITSTPVSYQLLVPTAGAASALDLANWQALNFPLYGQGTARWELSADGLTATQVVNADPSILLSDIDLLDGLLQGAMRVGTTFDDDYIGLVFGYQDPDHYYLFCWKQGTQDLAGYGLARRGMSLRVIDRDQAEPYRPWPSDMPPEDGRVLFENAVGWEDLTDYTVTLEHHPGEIGISVVHADGRVLEHIRAFDDTYDGGLFGFYNFSQDHVAYRGFRHEVLATRTYRYQAEGVDPDGDSLTWHLADGPQGATMDTQTGLLTWPTTSADVGTHELTVVLTDNYGATDVQTWHIVVADEAPVLIGHPPTRALVGQPYVYDPVVVDPTPADTRLFTLDTGPEGLTQNPITGLISFTPDTDQVGTTPVGYHVTDAAGHSAVETYELEILPEGNHAPRLLTELPIEVVLDLPFRLRLEAEDADGDDLSFHLSVAENGFAVNSRTGLLSWDPVPGDTRLTVTVTDPEGLSDSRSVTLHTVRDAPPVFDLLPAATHGAGRPYRQTVRATDPEGLPVTYALIAGPAGMTLDGDTLAWPAELAEAGTWLLVVEAADTRHQVREVVTLTVFPNQAPTSRHAPPEFQRLELPFAYQIEADDAEGDAVSVRLDNGPEGMTLDGDTLHWQPTQAGNTLITVVLSDALGAETAVTWGVEVVANKAPVFATSPPTTGSVGTVYQYSPLLEDPEGDTWTLALTEAPAGMTLDNGVLTWTPAADGTSRHDVALEARDVLGAVAVQAWTIDLLNHPPVFISTGLPPAEARVPWTFTPAVSDPDGHTLLLTLVDGPAGMSLDGDSLHMQPTRAQLGTHAVTLAARDSEGAETLAVFDLEVTGEALAILGTPPAGVVVGEMWTFQAGVTAPEPVTWAVTGPTGMQVDTNGRLTWIPQQTGTESATLTATDDDGVTAVRTWTVTVSANNAPRFLSLPPTAVTVGMPFVYAPVTVDDEGHAVTLTLTQAPAGMVLDNGVLTWTSGPDDVGTHTLVLTARDHLGAEAGQAWDLWVHDTAEDLPVIVSTPTQDAYVGLVYAYAAVPGDPDRLPRRFVLHQAPDGMTVDPGRGVVTWTPQPDQVGDHVVTLQLGDGFGETAQTWTVHVGPGGDHTPPDVFMNLDKVRLDIGATVTLHPVYLDDVGVTEIRVTLNGEPVTLDADGRARYIATSPGVYTARVEVSDAAGNQAAHAQAFWVRAPGDTEAPVAVIHSPMRDVTVTESTEVVITVSDAHLAVWQLELIPMGQESCKQVLAEGSGPRDHEAVAVFDPGLLENGLYTLRLVAWDVNDQGREDKAVLPLDGFNKPGRMVFQVQDMQVPLRGIPVSVDRIYDSGRTCPGDFGYGWALADARVQASITLGRALTLEEKSYCVGIGGSITYPPYNACNGVELPLYCIEEAVPHYVTVTFSGGQSHGFDLILTQPDNGDNWGGCRRDQPPEMVIPSFQAREGTTASLELVDLSPILFRNVINEDGHNEYMALNTDGDPWEPTRFRFITEQGIIFELDRHSGIVAVTDREGNSVTYGPNAIRHSSGTQISFTRDGQGRITRAVDPMGAEVAYAYDAAGNLISVTDRLGAVTRYTYDDDHHLIDIATPDGAVPARFFYDAGGRLIAQEDAYGKRISYTHDQTNRQEIVYDTDGHASVYTYDAYGQVRSATNAEGETTTYTYDAAHRETSRTVAVGTPEEASTFRVYDAAGNVTAETDALGRITATSYDGYGNPVTVTLPDGASSSLVYDTYGRPTHITGVDGAAFSSQYEVEGNRLVVLTTDPGGAVSRTEYNSRGYIVREVDRAGAEVTYSHDAAGRVLTETRAGRTWTRAYDAAGRLVREVDPDGAVRLTGYDTTGRITSRTDALGHTTATEYDVRGLAVAVTAPDGGVTRFRYDGMGRRTAEIDPLGRVTRTAYDRVGRPIATTFPDGSVARVAYDAQGRETVITDARGNSTTTTYDAVGNVLTVTDALGAVTTTTYDNRDLPLTVTDPLGRVTTYVYDAGGRLTHETAPDGATTAFVYDMQGRMTQRTDPDGAVTLYDYDVMGNLVTVTDPLAAVTTHAYDQDGNQVGTTDALGHSTSWTHDIRGNIVDHRLPSGALTGYVYNTESLLTSVTDAGGAVTTYTYDAAGRETMRRYDDDTSVVTTYDLVGNRIGVTDGRGETVYSYDALNRLVGRNDPEGSWVVYTYDEVGNLIARAIPGSETRFAFDAANQLVSVLHPDGTETRYTYNVAGERTAAFHANGTQTHYAYDAGGRLADVLHTTDTGIILGHYSTTRDDAGHVVRLEDHTGRVVIYTYDTAHRLIGEEDTHPEYGTLETTYVLDAVGNRVRQTRQGQETDYAFDADNRLLETGATSYSYDAVGRTVAHEGTEGTTTYAYNAAGLLTEVDGPSGLAQFHYDADGRRIAATRDGMETEYLVDDETDAQVLSEATDGRTTEYIRGGGLLRRLIDGGTDDDTYHHDGHGNVIGLSGSDGAEGRSYRYDANGQEQSPDPNDTNPFRYTGEAYEPAIGGTYLRARYYLPNQGRFLTRDTWPGRPEHPITQHAYLYGNANPVSYIDPSGNFGFLDLLGALKTDSEGNAVSFTSYRVFIDKAKCVAVEFVAEAAIDALLTEITSGIYIFQDISGKPYVGTSKHIPTRLSQHLKNRLQSVEKVLVTFGMGKNQKPRQLLEAFFMEQIGVNNTANGRREVALEPRNKKRKGMRRFLKNLDWCKK